MYSNRADAHGRPDLRPAGGAGGSLANQTIECVRFLAEMRLSRWLRIGALTAAICCSIPGQNTPSKDPQIETKGMMPRTSAADYEAQGQAGAVTIGAEFAGHGIPTPQGPLDMDNYVAIEVGLFGAPGARTKISATDFSLRINGKKAVPSQAFGRVLEFVKDPQWAPPVPVEAKSNTSLIGDEQKDQRADPTMPPPPVKIPVPVLREWAQRVQKAVLPEGDRPLPQAGMIFFPYGGKVKSIFRLELIYAGPAGKAVLALHP